MRNIAGGESLLDIHENSLKGNQIEKEIHADLKTLNKYKNLENSLTDIDFHFIAVSAFATDNPTVAALKESAPQMEPWGFGEVVEFGT